MNDEILEMKKKIEDFTDLVTTKKVTVDDVSEFANYIMENKCLIPVVVYPYSRRSDVFRVLQIFHSVLFRVKESKYYNEMVKITGHLIIKKTKEELEVERLMEKYKDIRNETWTHKKYDERLTSWFTNFLEENVVEILRCHSSAG